MAGWPPFQLVEGTDIRGFVFVMAAIMASAAQGGVVSLLEHSGMGQTRSALYGGTALNTGGARDTSSGNSLFIGRKQGSFFEDRPAHVPVYPKADVAVITGTDVEVIRALITQAESRRDGYDAVQHGARIKPPAKPTQMTIAQIFQWIKDTPGQPHAIGKYQFIPKTLARVVRKAGVSPAARFSPAVQDRLGDVLLAEAGLQRFRSGKLSRVAFMNNLAKIWAGLPNSSGKSHYDGYAGNKASITWARFEAAMKQVTPKG